MISAKSFTFIALLKPEAKNPPKGAITDAKRERIKECNWKGDKVYKGVLLIAVELNSNRKRGTVGLNRGFTSHEIP